MTESLIELVKVLVWPSLILFIFVSLKSPIRSLLEQLPGMAAKASKISFSGVSLEIDHKLRGANDNPELRAVMKDLTTPALKELLESGHKPFRYLSKDWDKSDAFATTLHELQSKGLIDIHEGKRDPKYPFEYKTTELGGQAYDILIQSIVDIFIAVDSNEKI